MRDSIERITAVIASNRKESMAAVSRPNALYSTKMTRVNTSNRISDGVPKSESVYSATRRDPDAIPGRSCRSVTRLNARQRVVPSVRAASTSCWSKDSSDARVVMNTYG